MYLCCNVISTGTSDYSARSGKVTVTEDALFQCISIPIRSYTYRESTECFIFEISSSSTVSGLTVNPSETDICIIDKDCKLTQSVNANLLYIIAIPITIGLTNRLYYVSESAVSVAICYKVLSGQTATCSIILLMVTQKVKFN